MWNPVFFPHSHPFAPSSHSLSLLPSSFLLSFHPPSFPPTTLYFLPRQPSLHLYNLRDSMYNDFCLAVLKMNFNSTLLFSYLYHWLVLTFTFVNYSQVITNDNVVTKWQCHSRDTCFIASNPNTTILFYFTLTSVSDTQLMYDSLHYTLFL